jgi:hypothetical protein
MKYSRRFATNASSLTICYHMLIAENFNTYLVPRDCYDC